MKKNNEKYKYYILKLIPSCFNSLYVILNPAACG